MKILVFGSNGMAGHMVSQYLKTQGHNVFTCARNNADYCLDIENQNLDFYDKLTNFDYVINCIGLLVKDSLDNPDRAILINGWFPHFLEKKLKNTSTKLIHLSTDCVFDGKKGNYIETDIHTETNFYGKSKSIGEIDNDKDITFRMSIIGPEIKSNGTGLLNWVITNPNNELPGWTNALWNGITTLQLAKCIQTYIEQPIITGIYHLVNNLVSINKYDLLKEINNVYGLNKIIVETQGPKSINKILIDTRQILDFKIPGYTQQLIELKNFSKNKK